MRCGRGNEWDNRAKNKALQEGYRSVRGRAEGTGKKNCAGWAGEENGWAARSNKRSGREARKRGAGKLRNPIKQWEQLGVAEGRR